MLFKCIEDFTLPSFEDSDIDFHVYKDSVWYGDFDKNREYQEFKNLQNKYGEIEIHNDLFKLVFENINVDIDKMISKDYNKLTGKELKDYVKSMLIHISYSLINNAERKYMLKDYSYSKERFISDFIIFAWDNYNHLFNELSDKLEEIYGLSTYFSKKDSGGIQVRYMLDIYYDSLREYMRTRNSEDMRTLLYLNLDL